MRPCMLGVALRGRRALTLAACIATAAVTAGPAEMAHGATHHPRRLNPIVVRTTPAVAGLPFEFSGVKFITDGSGSFVLPPYLLPAEVGIPKVGFAAIVLRLRMLPSRRADGVVYRLERVYQRFHRIAPRNTARVILAAIDAYVPVRFSLH